MSAIDVIQRLRSVGVALTLEGNDLRARPASRIPDDLDVEIKRYLPDLIEYLRVDPFALECRNPITPHSDHEHPWECNPNECMCYRRYRRVMFCEGAPCRWVWPRRSDS